MLAVDRAVAELRRGRAVHVAERAANGHGRGLVVAAVEAAPQTLLKRIAATGAPLWLLITRERADALGIADGTGAAVAVAVPASATIDTLRTLAGAGVEGSAAHAAFDVDSDPPFAEVAAACFRLAKAGRLLPALLAIEAAAPPDASLLSVDVADVHRHGAPARPRLKRISQSRVPLADALDCELALFRDEHGLGEHVAVLIGSPDLRGVVPVRLHSACLTGDLLGSLRCDCGEQLRRAVRRIAELGGGVLLYLDQEGRGIGLANKLRAYKLQDGGLDTLDADRRLGFLEDERTYDVAAALLRELGVSRVDLLTNNPQKIAALRAHGIDVAGRVPLVGTANSHNARYLKAKRERAGHLE
ncbi:MAG TPA: GTP cyclohydrolase II [Gammaproteobacteria bacterium]